MLTLIKSITKYLPLVALGKDVRNSYTEEHGKDRPFWLSRRFIGSVIALGGGFVAVHYGVKIDAATLLTMTDSVEKMASAGVALYGAVVVVIGIMQRKPAEDK